MEILLKDSKLKSKAIKKLLLILVAFFSAYNVSFAQSKFEVKGNEIGNIKIFPNPLTDVEHIDIEFETAIVGTIAFTIIDQIGNPYLVSERRFDEPVTKVSMDLSSVGLRPGIYFFRIQQHSKKEKVLKIIKK